MPCWRRQQGEPRVLVEEVRVSREEKRHKPAGEEEREEEIDRLIQIASRTLQQQDFESEVDRLIREQAKLLYSQT